MNWLGFFCVRGSCPEKISSGTEAIVSKCYLLDDFSLPEVLLNYPLRDERKPSRNDPLRGWVCKSRSFLDTREETEEVDGGICLVIRSADYYCLTVSVAGSCKCSLSVCGVNRKPPTCLAWYDDYTLFGYRYFCLSDCSCLTALECSFISSSLAYSSRSRTVEGLNALALIRWETVDEQPCLSSVWRVSFGS